MATAERRVLVVTGCPRSGTTAVGRALARSRGAEGIHEPLNALAGDFQISAYFEVPGSSSLSVDHAVHIAERVRDMRLNLRIGIFPEDGPLKRSAKAVFGGRTRLSYRRASLSRPETLIWKDPFAIFWIPLLRSLGMDSVVTYRPPLAVAASFSRLNWLFDIEKIRKRLDEAGFLVAPEIEHLLQAGARSESSLNGAAIWLLSYGWLLEDSTRQTLVVDAAKLAVRPAEYTTLLKMLNLHDTPNFQRWQSRATAAVELGGKKGRNYNQSAHGQRRDFTKLNSYYTQVLRSQDVRQIESSTSRISSSFSARLWPA